MCKKCYECFIERTGKIMLLCKQKYDKNNKMERLCICQRFCSDKDKYIPYKQKEGCKNYEGE